MNLPMSKQMTNQPQVEQSFVCKPTPVSRVNIVSGTGVPLIDDDGVLTVYTGGLNTIQPLFKKPTSVVTTGNTYVVLDTESKPVKQNHKSVIIKLLDMSYNTVSICSVFVDEFDKLTTSIPIDTPVRYKDVKGLLPEFINVILSNRLGDFDIEDNLLFLTYCFAETSVGYVSDIGSTVLFDFPVQKQNKTHELFIGMVVGKSNTHRVVEVDFAGNGSMELCLVGIHDIYDSVYFADNSKFEIEYEDGVEVSVTVQLNEYDNPEIFNVTVVEPTVYPSNKEVEQAISNDCCSCSVVEQG